jgi:hypothetical protein
MNNIFTKGDNIPFDDMLRNFFARRPKDVDGVANTSSLYYRQWLKKKIFARFEFDIPRSWDLDYFLDVLFMEGHICITDTPLGVVALRSGVTGIGIYNQPTTAIIANPVLGNFERTIDVDCAVIKLQYDWQGVGWMIERYATLLAMCDSSIAVNLMNTKATYVFMASSKAQAESYKKMYDDIAQGKPASFVNGDAINKENMFTMPAKENFIADDVQLLKRKIVNEFLTDIGINNTNLDKRERLTDDEVNANNEEVRFNIMHWYDNIMDGIKRANDLFGLDLKCSIRDYIKEVTADDDITERS